VIPFAFFMPLHHSVAAKNMETTGKMNHWLRVPILTRRRIVLALAVAILADGVQLMLSPLGWVGPDQIIDVIAMALTVWALGFHVLLLPTFVIEFIPGVNEFPTWTACVIAVIVLRKRAQRAAANQSSRLTL
jgi:hypothetical protein